MARPKHITAKSTKREYYKFLFILLLVAAAATLMSTTVSFHWTDWIRWLLGGIMLLFGGFKLITYESFLETFPKYDRFAKRYPLYNYAYPIIELLLGIFFILDFSAVLRNIVTVLIATEATVSLLGNLMRRGPSVNATWLHRVFRLPLSTTLLFENTLIMIFVILMILGSVAAI